MGSQDFPLCWASLVCWVGLPRSSAPAQPTTPGNHSLPPPLTHSEAGPLASIPVPWAPQTTMGSLEPPAAALPFPANQPNSWMCLPSTLGWLQPPCALAQRPACTHLCSPEWFGSNLLLLSRCPPPSSQPLSMGGAWEGWSLHSELLSIACQRWPLRVGGDAAPPSPAARTLRAPPPAQQHQACPKPLLCQGFPIPHPFPHSHQEVSRGLTFQDCSGAHAGVPGSTPRKSGCSTQTPGHLFSPPFRIAKH